MHKLPLKLRPVSAQSSGAQAAHAHPPLPKEGGGGRARARELELEQKPEHEQHPFESTRRRGALDGAEAATLARFLAAHPKPLLACAELARHSYSGPRSTKGLDCVASLIRAAEEARQYIAANISEGPQAAQIAGRALHAMVERNATAEQLREPVEILIGIAEAHVHPAYRAFMWGCTYLKDRGWLRVRGLHWSLTERCLAEMGPV